VCECSANICPLLLQAVHAVNMTHDSAHAQMDVKFRSLVCCGLKSVVILLSLIIIIFFLKLCVCCLDLNTTGNYVV